MFEAVILQVLERAGLGALNGGLAGAASAAILWAGSRTFGLDDRSPWPLRILVALVVVGAAFGLRRPVRSLDGLRRVVAQRERELAAMATFAGIGLLVGVGLGLWLYWTDLGSTGMPILALLFPYASLIVVVEGRGLGMALLVFWGLFLAQYPIYGAVLGRARCRGTMARTLLLVAALHGLAVAAWMAGFGMV